MGEPKTPLPSKYADAEAAHVARLREALFDRISVRDVEGTFQIHLAKDHTLRQLRKAGIDVNAEALS